MAAVEFESCWGTVEYTFNSTSTECPARSATSVAGTPAFNHSDTGACRRSYGRVVRKTTAQRYWLAALHAAHAADDRLLGANILKSMSLQCYDFDRPREALELARSAHEGAKGATPRAAAMLALREARAHSAIGDAAACERLIKQADVEFDRVTSTDTEPAFLGYFDESEFNAQVGTCYLDLGRPREADAYLSRTLRLVPATKVRDRATYVIRHASAQAQLGDADHAASLVAEAIPLIREAPSERNLRRVVRARQRLPFAKTDPRARALDDQLSTLGA